jgi:HD-GYP domain-containing protein (c-di-GMP phosphodiesterase class II)
LDKQKLLNSYFSVSFDLITTGREMIYDLYVNASEVKSKEKFVKLFPRGNELSPEDVENFKTKYLQLYVSEDQRKFFVRSLSANENLDDTEKTTIIKDNAIKYLQKIFDSGKEFNTEILSETIADCKEAVEGMVDVLNDHDIKDLHGLIGSLSFHDFYTYDHSINVSMYCISILKALKPNVTRSELVHVGLGGILHDLGKVKIPTHILNNPGKLSDEEYAEIQKHPDFGIDLLLDGHCKIPEGIDATVIARVIHEHHENWDGTGYPSRIADTDIHFLARVCAVADFFDAITTKRSYNEVLAINKAIGVMERTVGKKIDPQIFEVFKTHVAKIVVKNKVNLKLLDSFDPSIPYEKLPLERVEIKDDDEDYGQILIRDKAKNNKKAS